MGPYNAQRFSLLLYMGIVSSFQFSNCKDCKQFSHSSKQIPNEVVQPISLHVDDLEEKLRPPLNVEFLEYLLGLPDDLFVVVTNL